MRGTTFTAFRTENPITGKKVGNWQEPTGVKLQQGEKWLPYTGKDSLSEATKILVVEGEQCVDICNQNMRYGRAIYWTRSIKQTDWSCLKNKDVTICPDKDGVGYQRARMIFEEIKDIAKSVRFLKLPGLALKEDVVDCVNRGGNLHNACRTSIAIKSSSEIKPIIEIEHYGLKHMLDFMGLEIRYNLCKQQTEFRGKNKFHSLEQGHGKQPMLV